MIRVSGALSDPVMVISFVVYESCVLIDKKINVCFLNMRPRLIGSRK